MELEFDKEIDAILRKARSGIALGTVPANAAHLDADTIAAFAENALPEGAKLLYTEHFADCDGCRKQLSQSIAMNRGADAAAASTVSAPVEAATVPWYAGLFKTQNLAIALGSLVLVFSGVLGLMLLKRQGQEAAYNAAISQATEPDPGRGPYYSEGAAANSNTAPALSEANTAPANIAPGSIAPAANTATNTAPGAFGRTKSAEEKTADDDKAFALGGILDVSPARPAAVTGGAPRPPPADKPKTERDNNLKAGEDEARKEKDLTLADTQGSRSRMDREAIPNSLKKVGPSRAGPLQNQTNQQNSNLYDMSVTRSVGGKTFANRNGAWFDTGYGGQSPVMIRRGSSEFKKLDGGLRNIANELYGTVIVVWKGKAYRIY